VFDRTFGENGNGYSLNIRFQFGFCPQFGNVLKDISATLTAKAKQLGLYFWGEEKEKHEKEKKRRTKNRRRKRRAKGVER